MEILGKLFGGAGIVKILRLFLFNQDEPFEVKDIVKRTRANSDVVHNELSMLHKIGFVRKRSFYKEVERPKPRRRTTRVQKPKRVKRRRVSGWILNKDFPYLEALQTLLVGTTPLEAEGVVRRLKKVGNVKVIIMAGVFVQHWDSRIDILVVGDNIKKAVFSNVMKDVESELGREIRYALFSTQDFKYRLGMYDRLIRDILDYPHKAVVDRIGLP